MSPHNPNSVRHRERPKGAAADHNHGNLGSDEGMGVGIVASRGGTGTALAGALHSSEKWMNFLFEHPTNFFCLFVFLRN